MVRWLVFVVLAAACGQDGESDGPQGSTFADAPARIVRGVCALCSTDTDCASGICRQYGDGNRKCTLACTVGQPVDACAAPSTGFCNGMGYCTCPYIDPPHDAGTGDPPMDAATIPLDAATGP